MNKQHEMEVARTLYASDSPINRSPLARVLGIARSSLYVQCKRPKADKELAVRIEAAHEKDDTMDHRKLAALRRNREESDQASDAHIWDRCPTPVAKREGLPWQSNRDCAH
jgi:hypothetical protein